MTESIGITDWMAAAPTLAVINALEERGYVGCARFVGGAVRNALMGLPVDDIDIATTLTPDQVTEALTAAGIRVVPTGVEHGTVTAVVDHHPFEITTLRRDVSTDGRNATVVFTHDWNEDALRRDFRFNALYADARGHVFDPTGQGVEDARQGRVVFVGDPMVRLREDYLRILRFFRFYGWYAKGAPDKAALEACRALRGMLAGRSAERVQKELLKLLAAPDPRAALILMGRTGVLAEILPLAKGLDQVERLIDTDRSQAFGPDPDLRLAAMLPEDPKVARNTAERLRLSNATRDRLAAALAAEPRVTSWMSGKAARRAIWRAGASAFKDRVRLAWAMPQSLGQVDQWLALLELADRWERPELPVRGEDALNLGSPKGQAVGRALFEFEEWWVDEDFPPDREHALARLEQIVSALSS
jgi:poly(A) polymerase